jgi:prepilin-type N-terminal cleavage/methylation domain-containing protein
MLYLRKRNKGFTLIELMIVVAIVGTLVLLGIRLYTGQQEKAKHAIIKANCSTIQTLIQGNMADKDYNIGGTCARVTAAINDIPNAAGCKNPLTKATGTAGVIFNDCGALNDHGSGHRGKVAIASPSQDYFIIQGLDKHLNPLPAKAREN